MWIVDPTPFRGFGYRKLECRNTLQQECRNRDMIGAVDSRSDLDHRIIGQLASDWNFVDLDSRKHGVENREMRDRDKTWTIVYMEISTVDQTR
jgi:hypothetical protein